MNIPARFLARTWIAVLVLTSALGAAHASDVGVAGPSATLKADTLTGTERLKSLQKGANIHLGTQPTPLQLSGQLEIYFVDAPHNKGVLPLPAPWASTSATTAKFKNLQAPLGPTSVKTAVVRNGVVAKVTARGLGGLDLSAPPGPNGVMAILTLDNAADSSSHRMCTLYSTGAGGEVRHRVTPRGFDLKLRRGVASPCPDCTDGFLNGEETDVDCGGGSCDACEDGGSCVLAADCLSGVCADGVCQPATCIDGVKNGTESDTDCGGACSDCTAGDTCNGANDCDSNVCIGNVCQAATCSDGVDNGTETGIDCGGGACPTCPVGQGCSGPSDCQSEVCTANVCQTPGCSDGVENGNETGVDCGGPTCGDCPAGEGCNGPADCQSQVCTGNVCQAPSCSDGLQNGNESDLDCGGSCPGCPIGGDCNLNSDCQTNKCVDHVCQAPTCTDGSKNGSETDVDCGGPSCPDCALGKTCSGNSDCLTNFCSGGVCRCPAQLFTFNVNSNSGGVFDSAEWPGGTATQNGPTGCSLTINRPNNNIDQVCTLGAPFSVNSFSGYSSCAGSGGEDGDGCQPVSCPPAGIGSCCGTRPSCSAALNGSGSARYLVQCQP
jgi:hypothetical protein